MAINRTPFNALVDDDGSNTVGTVWNKNQIKTVILDPIDALPGVTGAWTPYVPGWAGSDNIGPGIGNGILSGRYLRIGQWVDIAIVLSMGTTTTYGSSTYWMFSLPFTPYLVGSIAGQQTNLRAGAMTGGGSIQGALLAYSLGASVYISTASGGLVNPTTPFTWSSGALLSIRGSYEIP